MHNAFLFTFLCFVLTSIGAGLVFIIRRPNKVLSSFLNSFASGIMISSSIFSLIIPSIDYCKELNIKTWISLPLCFIVAYFVIIIIDKITKTKSDSINIKAVAFSMALHNIPEGMCVGFAFANATVFGGTSAFTSAVMIAIGIGIQNAPEGSSLSFPMYANGYSKLKSFLLSSMVGFVEVPSGIIAYLLGLNFLVILPYMLAFSSAIMLSVACLDLIPDAIHLNKKVATLGLFVGFIVMMLLDLALG